MHRVWTWVGVVLFLLLVRRGTHLLATEGWRTMVSQLQSGLPLYLVVLSIALVVFVYQERQYRRHLARRRRLQALQAEAARAQQQGDHRQANRLLDQCEVLFMQLYGESTEDFLQRRR